MVETEKLAEGDADTGTAAILTPIEASFLHVLNEFASHGFVDCLDEEAITSALLGGVTAVLPLAAKEFGSGTADTTQCAWGGYNKSSSSDLRSNESDRGADFALALWQSDAEMRIALFQAKAGKTSKDGKRNFLDVHRRPDDPNPLGTPEDKREPWRRPQMAILFRTGAMFEFAKELYKPDSYAADGQDLLQYAEVKADAELSRSQEEIHRTAAKLGWVHYLAYFSNEMKAVPMSAMTDAVSRQCKADASGVCNVDITDVGVNSFTAVIRRGVIDGPGDVAGWLVLPSVLARDLLPKLVDIMPVYIGRGRGGLGLNIGDWKELVDAPSSSDVQLRAGVAMRATPPGRKL